MFWVFITQINTPSHSSSVISSRHRSTDSVDRCLNDTDLFNIYGMSYKVNFKKYKDNKIKSNQIKWEYYFKNNTKIKVFSSSINLLLHHNCFYHNGVICSTYLRTVIGDGDIMSFWRKCHFWLGPTLDSYFYIRNHERYRYLKYIIII